MPSPSDDERPGASSWIEGVREALWPSTPARDAEDIVPDQERRAAMRSLDSNEVKLGTGALLLSIIVGIAIPVVFSLEHKVTHKGQHTVSVGPDAWLLGGGIVLLAIGGLVVVWKRKRTLVTFDLVFIGFAFTLFIGLLGFAFIFLGGWLFLRAWRLGRYGTTSGKVVARQSAERRAAKKGGAVPAPRTKSGSKSATSGPGERKAPAASKRYTPKAAPKKKAPKPTT